MEPIPVEAQRLREQCAGTARADADPDLTALRRRYLCLLESEPVPSDGLRRDIRRDLARAAADDTRAAVIALLLGAAAVLWFARYTAQVSPVLAGDVGFAVTVGLLLVVPALTAGEATRWRSAVRTSSRRELDELLPRL